MKITEYETYESPSVREACIDLCSFLCVSIKEMTLEIDVDEYINTGEEVLNFDSDQ